jgi:hypothetical protein
MKNMLFGFSIFLLTITSALVGDITSELDAFCKIDCPIKPKKKCSCRCPGKYQKHQRHHGSHPHIHLLEGTSLNWSGYAAITSILHPTNDSVTSVSGTWTVPALSASTDKTYCAIWVGIDGFSSSTVEQIGTEHDWSGRSQSNYAWFEMYPSGAYEIVGFPVDVHDSISAEVSYTGQNTFQLILVNNTKNAYTIVPSSYTKSTKALRSSAEWIVEAPSSNGGVLPLSHYGTIAFTNCRATINGFTGPINSLHWANDPLTMVSQFGIIKSFPSSLAAGGESFTTTWEHE